MIWLSNRYTFSEYLGLWILKLIQYFQSYSHFSDSTYRFYFLVAILFSSFEGQGQIFQLGILFFHNQHPQNRLKTFHTDFYSKMPVEVSFSEIWSSLVIVTAKLSSLCLRGHVIGSRIRRIVYCFVTYFKLYYWIN